MAVIVRRSDMLISVCERNWRAIEDPFHSGQGLALLLRAEGQNEQVGM